MPNLVRLHRVIATRPEKVYRAFLEPDAIPRWLPPYGYLCTVHELNATVGGVHRMSFRNFTTGLRGAISGPHPQRKAGLHRQLRRPPPSRRDQGDRHLEGRVGRH